MDIEFCNVQYFMNKVKDMWKNALFFAISCQNSKKLLYMYADLRLEQN